MDPDTDTRGRRGHVAVEAGTRVMWEHRQAGERRGAHPPLSRQPQHSPADTLISDLASRRCERKFLLFETTQPQCTVSCQLMIRRPQSRTRGFREAPRGMEWVGPVGVPLQRGGHPRRSQQGEGAGSAGAQEGGAAAHGRGGGEAMEARGGGREEPGGGSRGLFLVL